MNSFKRVQIGSDIFMKNDNNDLLQLQDGRFKCYGRYDTESKQATVMKTLNPLNLKHEEEEKLKHDKSIFYFMSRDNMHYHSILMCEFLKDKFNVFVIGEHLWNVKINDVYYMDVCDQDNLKRLNLIVDEVKSVYVESWSFFLHFTRFNFNNANVVFVYHHKKFSGNYGGVELNDHGLHFVTNMVQLVDKIFFYCESDKNFWIKTRKPSPSVIAKCTVSKYIINNIIFKPPTDKKLQIEAEEKKKQADATTNIVCYDQYIDDALTFFECYRAHVDSNATMTVFQNQPECLYLKSAAEGKLPDNINIASRNTENLIKQLRYADVFFTAENRTYTHFMIWLSVKCVSKLYIPTYFSDSKFLPGGTVEFHDGIKKLSESLKGISNKTKHDESCSKEPIKQ